MASPGAGDETWRWPTRGSAGPADHRTRAGRRGARCWWGRRAFRRREAAQDPRALWRSGAERNPPFRPYERTVSALMVGPVTLTVTNSERVRTATQAWPRPTPSRSWAGSEGAFGWREELSTGLSVAECAHLASKGEPTELWRRRSEGDRLMVEARDRARGGEWPCGGRGRAAVPGESREGRLVRCCAVDAGTGVIHPGMAGQCGSPAVSHGPRAVACRRGIAPPPRHHRRATPLPDIEMSVGSAETRSPLGVG